MKLFQNELVKNLPDCYNKQTESNNYKIMQLLKYDADNFQVCMQELLSSLNLDEATGYTLDLYGILVGQKRGLSTDEQYRILIKTKMARNTSGGNYQSIVNCLCLILGCEPSDVLIEELDDACAIEVVKVPLDGLIYGDLTADHFVQILKSLLPAGVGLGNVYFEGTFEFADEEGSESLTSGFCQNENDTYGGFFGLLFSSTQSIVLPI